MEERGGNFLPSPQTKQEGFKELLQEPHVPPGIGGHKARDLSGARADREDSLTLQPTPPALGRESSLG